MVPVQRECDVENFYDFSRYYGHSWVGWHGEKDDFVTPCYVGASYGGNQIHLRMLHNSPDKGFWLDGGERYLWDDLKLKIDFGIPDIGMVQEGPTIQFHSYNTPRQAKKGYRYRDNRFTDFNSWDIRKKYTSKPAQERFDICWFVFNPEYKTLEQAEELLGKGELVGVPISRTLGAYTLPKFKHSLLAYKRWTIGYISSPTLVHLKRAYEDYGEDVFNQTGAEIAIVG